MFASSDFVVIGMAMLALAFFMWYAIAGATKNRGSSREAAAHQEKKRQGDVKRSAT
jgi:Flp pilus assembly protein TadB